MEYIFGCTCWQFQLQSSPTPYKICKTQKETRGITKSNQKQESCMAKKKLQNCTNVYQQNTWKYGGKYMELNYEGTASGVEENKFQLG